MDFKILYLKVESNFRKQIKLLHSSKKEKKNRNEIKSNKHRFNFILSILCFFAQKCYAAKLWHERVLKHFKFTKRREEALMNRQMGMSHVYGSNTDLKESNKIVNSDLIQISLS